MLLRFNHDKTIYTPEIKNQIQKFKRDVENKHRRCDQQSDIKLFERIRISNEREIRIFDYDGFLSNCQFYNELYSVVLLPHNGYEGILVSQFWYCLFTIFLLNYPYYLYLKYNMAIVDVNVVKEISFSNNLENL